MGRRWGHGYGSGPVIWGRVGDMGLVSRMWGRMCDVRRVRDMGQVLIYGAG